jgi:hypothetical protein
MMRLRTLFLGAVAIVAASVHSSPAAADGPWCLLIFGGNGADRSCAYASLEECRVSAVGTGFCTPNPAYRPPVVEPPQVVETPPPPAAKKKRTTTIRQ